MIGFKKIRLFMIISFLLFSMIFYYSPDIVVAGSFTVEDWDDYVVGATSGTGAYGSWENDEDNAWDIDSTWSYSGTRALKASITSSSPSSIYCWYNFSADITETYITIAINYTAEWLHSGKGTICYIYFYRDGVEQLRIEQAAYYTWGNYKSTFRDVDNVQQTLEIIDGYLLGYSEHTCERLFTIQWINTNWFRYSVYNLTTQTLITSVDGSGRDTNTYAGFDQIVFYADASGNADMYPHVDDIYVTDAPALLTGGDINIGVYNETSPSVAIPNWSILITDAIGVIKYSANNLNNPVVINTTEYGLGFRYFTIGADNYSNRTYYTTIEDGVNYTLDAFLPWSGNAHYYFIRTVDGTGAPIYDVFVEVTKIINGSRQRIAEDYTSGTGYVVFSLIPDETYYLNLTHPDYTSLLNQQLIPSSTEYGSEYPIVYQMASKCTYFLNETMFHEKVLFNVEISNDILYCNYTDLLTNTTDTNMYIYEINQSTGTTSLYTGVYTETDVNSWSYNIAINESNCYEIYIFLNHTNYEPYTFYRMLCGDNLSYRHITSTTTINWLFTVNYGYCPFGWSNLIAFFLMTATFFSFGQLYCGISLMLTGFILLFINVVIGLTVIAALVPTFFIILSILVLWSAHRRVPS